MVRLAILADDLTGAADAGGAFAALGLRTTLVLDGQPVGRPDVLVHSTGSRAMSASGAKEVNREVAASLPRHALVYKKIDSMLRGHPCQELGAVLDGRRQTLALIAPAIPSQRRTTVGGYQRIRGSRTIDLMTTFGARPDLPVRRLDLWTVQQGPESVAQAIEATGVGLVVADAVTDADLASIAGGVIASGLRVVAGAAGLARQLAVVLAGTSAPSAMEPVGQGVVLIVAGSQHPATAAQVATLEAAGIPVVRPSQAILHGDDPAHHQVVDDLCARLGESPVAVLTTAGLEGSRQGGAFVSSTLAEIAAGIASRHRLGGLILTGGDVAAAVVKRLEATAIHLGGEVLPAIPWGILRSSHAPECPVVTKAGSFGDPDALAACAAFLQGDRSSP